MLEYIQQDDVACLTIDDGKANAVGFAFIEETNEALDRAGREAKAVVLTGRTGILSGGFDLKEVRKGADAAMELVDRGSRLMLRLFSLPQPLVIACSGHAVAAGAFLLLAADTRIGVSGDFKIGLNETTIGMTLPNFGLELATARLSKRYLTAAVIHANLFDPMGAKAAGFLDEVVSADVLLERAMTAAQALALLPAEAYAGNKLAVRKAAIDRISAGL